MIEIKDDILIYWDISRKVSKRELEEELRLLETVDELDETVIDKLSVGSRWRVPPEKYKENNKSDIEKVKMALKLFDMRSKEHILNVVDMEEVEKKPVIR